MAAQVAAAAPTEDAGAVYLSAVRAIFSRWTLLRLAVDQDVQAKALLQLW